MDFASAFSSQPRGLHNFISDIRNAKSKEDERMRVDKELANIRQKFSTPANMTSYDKKKYVWKLCYIYMLGYEIDFGHVEFISLLSSTKFQEKSVGYMAFSMMFRPGDELMTLAVNSMRNDIVGQLHHGQTLALAAVSNMGGNDLAEALSGDVQRLVVSPSDAIQVYSVNANNEEMYRNKALLCKKAALCLLRLYRTNPECVQVEDWITKISKLLEDRDLGVITSVMSLLLGFASSNTASFEGLVPYVISILTRLVVNRTCSPDYLYYFTPSPWLQVKCLRFLQYYRVPADHHQLEMLSEVLGKILVKTEASESNNKSNADHSILFEAINLVILYGNECPPHLKEHCINLLGRFISVKDPNTRYLGIDAMTRMAKLDGPEAAEPHQAAVLDSLKDTDISIRKKSLNLLYVMTFEKNAKEIVGELVNNLPLADSEIKEDIVAKIAILAEKYGSDLNWYIDTMMQVMLLAGDYVSEAVWYRVVQVVINNKNIHEYAAKKMLESVQSKYSHEIIIAVAGYLLGEIGVDICEQPGSTGYDQFAALHQHYANATTKVQGILLTAYMKFINLYPEQVKDIITDIYTKYSKSSLLEIQQRACEYGRLSQFSASLLENVLSAVPAPALQDWESILVNADKEKKVDADRSAFEHNAGSVPRPVAKTTTVSAQPVAKSVDSLLDFDDTSSSPSSSSSGPAINLSADTLAKINVYLKTVRVTRGFNTKSPLASTDVADISISHDYRNHQGRMYVNMYNKSDFDVNNLTAELKSAEGHNFKLIAAVPVKVSPGDEARIQIASECLRPFADTPLLEISFNVGRSLYQYSIPLPTSVLSYSVPLSVDKDSFMNRWKSITTPGSEQQQVFQATEQVTPAYIANLKNSIFPALNIALVEGIDQPNTATGAFSFVTGTVGADGKNVSVGCLLRLEFDVNTSKFRLTVRTTNAQTSQAVLTTLGKQLS